MSTFARQNPHNNKTQILHSVPIHSRKGLFTQKLNDIQNPISKGVWGIFLKKEDDKREEEKSPYSLFLKELQNMEFK